MNEPTKKPNYDDPNHQSVSGDEDGLALQKETLKDLDAPLDQQNAIKGASIIDCATRKA